jgi:ABC-type transport system substrate-binding protein/ABC-type dipeptide/oligopeptide/nickel transport system permease component
MGSKQHSPLDWVARAWLLLLLGLMGLPASAATVRVALQLEPTTLDPTSGASAAIGEVTYRTLFEGLTTLDATGEPVPLLATSWSAAPDARSYLFHLRPGVHFSEGRPFDASVARASLMRAIRPGSTNPQAAELGEIAGVDVLDPLTIRIRLSRPDAGLPGTLARPGAVMVPTPVGELATHPIGTGPFRLADWQRGDRLTLTRNPGYWGASPAIAGISYRFIAEPAAAYAAVRTHAVDLFPDYPAPENLDQLRADPSLRVSVRPSEGEVILAFNNQWGPLRDIRVRRALSMPIDRRAIINGAMFGYGAPIGSHFPPQDPGYVDLTARYPHDPAAARALLAAAGYPHGFPVTLTLPPPSYARRSGEIVAAQLRAIGLAVTVLPVEWPTWLARVYGAHDFQLTIVNHAEPGDYDIYGRPDYYFGYDGRAVAALLDRLRATADPAARRGLLASIQRRIADDAANGFLFEFPHFQVADARLRHVWANTPLQAVDFSTVTISGVGQADENRAVDGTGGLGWIAAVFALGLGMLLLRLVGPALLLARAGVLAVTLLGASLLIFMATQALPGDPARFMLGMQASPAAIAALKEELGLSGSWPHRYLLWLAGLFRGDLGLSYSYRLPVGELLGPRLAVSLPLAIAATGLAAALGVGAAAWGAAKPGRWADRLVGWSARFGLAMPSFWLAALLLLLVAVRWRWLPASGFPGWGAGVEPASIALILPVLSLALPQAAVVARVARAALGAELGRDYVRFARAKGLGPATILWRHALPNALPPILALIGLLFPFLLAGSVLVEQVFGLPGVGRLVLDAVGARDLPVVAAVALMLAGATALASFLADLAQRAADPRLRHR